MKLPSGFEFVDLQDPIFSKVLQEVIYSTEDILVNSPAGTGKSLIIKIAAAVLSNCAVLSTTGLTALNLCSDNVKAQTVHSFFEFKPTEIIDFQDIQSISSTKRNVMRSLSTIIIDEVSMMSNHLFDCMIDKLIKVRKTLPRFILFGDLMQLSPVVNMKDNTVVGDFFRKEYKGNVMFFNSHHFPYMNFKTLQLRKIYRQTDMVFKNHLIEVGYNETTPETFDYFNERVMTIKQYEKDHPNYLRIAPTNAIVNKINKEYIESLPGTAKEYTAKVSNWKGTFPNDLTVSLKVGAQVICLMNRIDPTTNSDYRNGTIGVIEKVYNDYVVIRKTDGKHTNVVRGKVQQYEFYSDGTTIQNRESGSFKQIECKAAKSLTYHKMQGRTLDAAYLQLTGWMPQGLLYVGLSRVTAIAGLGISRKLSASDITYNQESWDFLQKGMIRTKEEEEKDDEQFTGSAPTAA